MSLPGSNDQKRRVPCLAQDIRGCSDVKDLPWIQFSDSKAAFQLLQLGLKHQSVACSKRDPHSRRSRSVSTLQRLKTEDREDPAVTRVSEVALCGLAGSERRSKTRNEGDRLKESGNINTFLLILGKCLHALKNSQQPKLQLHVPFRDTRFLQGFFRGRGKLYRMVNISQCAAACDERSMCSSSQQLPQKFVFKTLLTLPKSSQLSRSLQETRLS